MSDASARTLPFVLGVVGDSGSGKSTVAAGVRALIGPERVTSVELDDYHRYSRAERQERGLTALNPLVHNLAIVQEHLQLLRAGRPIRNRSYDHTDGSFGPIRVIEPREVVIARGLLGFPSDELREAYDLAVFLHPEPELLFRWKLRRDVSTRGYTEAEVLKYIAKHLLDSKEYVVPQSERADLVVRYEIAAWEAPDSEVRISVILRRRAADALRHGQPFVRFGDSVRLEDRDGELVLHLTSDLTAAVVDAWAGELFPDTYDAEAVGTYTDQDGGAARGAPIAFAEVLIAHLTQRLRRTEELAVDRFDGAAQVEGMAG
ncbi:MAG: phosphoribulokinase [Gemmatimonadota bacterium]|nr:phosphoribulokinase [Gemmatimonadota bacterium]